MRRGGKTNAKGRNRHEQYVPLPYNLIHSEAWRSLNPASMKLYLELRSRYHGSNNGELSLSYADARKLLGIGRSTIQKAFNELEVKGFTELVTEGHWYGRKAAEWRVTDCRHIDRPATNEWRNWKPGVSFKKTEVGPETGHIHYLTVPSGERRA